jgi:PAS domain S-box-containing protein
MAEAPSAESHPNGDRSGAKTEADLHCELLLSSSSRCAIIFLDPAGVISVWSEGARALYGYAASEVLHRPVSILFAPRDGNAGASEEFLNAVRASGPLVDWNMSRVRKDGSSFSVAAALSLLTSADGNFRGYCDIAIDTVDCTRAQAQLIEQYRQRESVWRQDEKMYLALMHSLTPNIALLDRTGTIVMVNEAWDRFARENGADVEDGIGLGANYLDVCRRSAQDCEYASLALAGLRAVLAGLQDEFTLEYPCHSPQLQRWFRLSASPWLEEGGAVVSHTDVTERVLAERKLQESERHFRALIENEVDIVTILDEKGYIKFESPAIKRILGYSPDELVGKCVFNFIHPADVPAVKQAFADVLSSHEPSEPLEFRFRHERSGYRVVESIARNLVANPGVAGVIVNTRDITLRRQAEAALRKRDEALKLSHERLRALNGRMLETEDRERRRISRELHDDLNQALAALAVDIGAVRNALGTSRPEDVKLEVRALQERVVKLSENVRHLAYQLHPSILDHLGLAVALRSYCEDFSRREGIEVEFIHRNADLDVSPQVASCVYRVAQEALRNVAKHSKATRASVYLVQTDRFVNLVVRDMGVGFVPARIPAGHSLGLTSMEERSRLLNGKFQVVSAPGQGTVVKLQVVREVQTKS